MCDIDHDTGSIHSPNTGYPGLAKASMHFTAGHDITDFIGVVMHRGDAANTLFVSLAYPAGTTLQKIAAFDAKYYPGFTCSMGG
jgi:hypothetical protein